MATATSDACHPRALIPLPAVASAQCHRFLVKIQANLGDMLLQDPSPMDESRHRSFRCNLCLPAATVVDGAPRGDAWELVP